ncbi:MAG: FAD-dependent oxidoreductase [Actinomycetota bacterium]|nr:FAD-dependent oxidoreductase [Actinomycetota bacterium]
MKSVVVVGASLSGVRAADSILKNNDDVEVTLIGGEAHPPYNRPPLSKEALALGVGLESIKLKVPNHGRRLSTTYGKPVVKHERLTKEVILDDGTLFSYDCLVIATGIRPRRLDIPRVDSVIYPLRTFDDMNRIVARLTLGPSSSKRIVVLGAGFIGCEVAATLTTLGHAVTVVAPEDVPMQKPLGRELGGEIHRRHLENGVTFMMNVRPIAVHTSKDQSGKTFVDQPDVEVILSDATSIYCDLVVEAVGSIPNTSFLDGTLFDLSDGILVDDHLFAGDGVFAVGDVARYPNLIVDETPRRVEHWGLAVDSGRYVGKSVRSYFGGEATEAFSTLPAFWSDQFDIRIQSFGLPGLANDEAISLIEGDVKGDCVFGYHSDDCLVGVVAVGMTKEHGRLRAMVEDSLSQRRDLLQSS